MIQPSSGSRGPQTSTIIAVILIAILAVVTVVAALTVFQLPDPITEQGRRTNNLYQAVLAVSFLVFFGVTAGIIWAIFRYRRRGPELPQQIHGSSVLEATWTIIPVIILVALFIPSFILVRDLKTPPSESEADILIEVIGRQWWWEFNYVRDGIRVQTTPPNYDDLVPPALVVPANRTILLRIRSADVVHSFYVPHTLYKIQAIPGNVNYLHFTVEKPGIYHGQCYQFCGLRHSDMLFVLDVRSQADYNRWLSEQRQAAAGAR